MKLEVATQETSLSRCASVPSAPWADEAEPQLSRLVHSACQLSVDVRIFEEGLMEGDCQGQHPIPGYV